MNKDTKLSVAIVKLVAKVFVPMGLLMPIIINMKMLFQSLCTMGVDWEDKLEGRVLTRWHLLVNDLLALKDIIASYCYFHLTNKQPINHQIHGLCDVSDNALTVVLYLQTEHSTGEVEVNFIASKAQLKFKCRVFGSKQLARLIDPILQTSTSLSIRATPELVEATFTDATGSIPLDVFAETTPEIMPGKSYKLTNIQLKGSWMTNPLFRSTEVELQEMQGTENREKLRYVMAIYNYVGPKPMEKLSKRMKRDSSADTGKDASNQEVEVA
ncbi:hypothetical protein ACROYT_G001264 [Oculina patagonica]